jgi:hypothetical protein
MKLPKQFITFLLCNIFITTILFAQWRSSSIDAVQVVDENLSQTNSQIKKTNGGQAIISWQDKRSGSNENIYLQCLNRTGVTDWQLNGVRISVSEGQQNYPQSISIDSTIIVVWQDNRSGVDYDIYAQKVSKSGELQWTNSGKPVCVATGHQYNPRLISDGQGGAIVVWQDRRNNTDYNIYAQRLNYDGEPQWGVQGVVVCSSVYDQFNAQIVIDGTGGAIIAWHDYSAGNGFIDIYAQRISSDGNILWSPANGVAICNATNNQNNLQMIADGFNGAILTWQDRRASSRDDIYAQKINSSGNKLWDIDGIPVSTISGYKYFPQLASDRGGGAIITWQDNRNGTDYNIYAQSVSFEGVVNWDVNGIPVCTAGGQQYYPQITTDRNGNAIVVWQDRRNGNDYDIFTQRIKTDGTVAWTSNGVPVSNTTYDQVEPRIVSDDEGGAIISWTDYRSGTGYSDIYANRIGVNGLLAGGSFRTFTQSDFTVKAVNIKKSVWYPKPMPTAGNVRDTLFKRLFTTSGLILGIAKPDSPYVYGWIKISRGYNAMKFLPQSGVARPFDLRGNRYFLKELRNPYPRTYNNHLAGELLALKLNIYASDLGITAGGLGELVFQDPLNNVFNGRTVRSIVNYTDSALTKWRTYIKSNHYLLLDTVLTKINSAFTGPIDSISTSPLKLTNVRGVFSVPFLKLSTINTQVIPMLSQSYDEQEPEDYILFQNYPNPFNPSTSIEFDLKEASPVTLKIYNTLGEEVATLLNMEDMDTGRNTITFDADGFASGVYFYKLIVNNGRYQQTKKMLLLK